MWGEEEGGEGERMCRPFGKEEERHITEKGTL